MHVTEVYSENPNLILLPTGLQIVWAERKVSVFTPTDCWKMHFPKSGKNSVTKNTLNLEPFFFWKKTGIPKKTRKNHMPGFEKVLQTLLKIKLKKAKTNELKTLKFILSQHSPRG